VWGAYDLDCEEKDIGLKGSPTRLRKVYTPKRLRGPVELLGGSPEEAARRLVEKLKEKYIL